MLAGYADLELRLLGCVRYALGDDIDIAARILYRTRGEEARISIADGIIRTRFETAGLGTTTCEAIADMSWCRRIRNQYAHCAWDVPDLSLPLDGLSFVNFDEVGKQHGTTAVFKYYVDLSLLKEQAAYFVYVHECLWLLEDAYKGWLAGKQTSQDHKPPKKLPRPALYSERAPSWNRPRGKAPEPAAPEPKAATDKPDSPK
jgi:hypothetical protein